MSNFLRQAPAAVALVLLLSACATGRSFQTYDDYNPNINFAGYQTFSFVSTNPMVISNAAGPVSPLLEGKMMNAIRRDLTAKGFRYVADPESADMAISFTVGSRDQIRVDQYPVAYRAGYGSYYRHYGYGVGYGTETRVRQYREGQIAIDIFDVRTKTPAFHGAASTRIRQSDRENPDELVSAIVTETLDGFPPGRVDFAQPNLVPLPTQP